MFQDRIRLSRGCRWSQHQGGPFPDFDTIQHTLDTAPVLLPSVASPLLGIIDVPTCCSYSVMVFLFVRHSAWRPCMSNTWNGVPVCQRLSRRPCMSDTRHGVTACSEAGVNARILPKCCCRAAKQALSTYSKGMRGCMLGQMPRARGEFEQYSSTAGHPVLSVGAEEQYNLIAAPCFRPN